MEEERRGPQNSRHRDSPIESVVRIDLMFRRHIPILRVIRSPIVQIQLLRRMSNTVGVDAQPASGSPFHLAIPVHSMAEG
jgi:hypothetical protein